MFDLKTTIIKNFIFPVYWGTVKRSKALDYLKILEKIQWKSFEENRAIQQKRLYDLMDYATNNIPYYQKVSVEREIKISEHSIFEDIKKFPVLTRSILKKNFDQLYKFRDKTHFKNFSGGSTGEPVSFYQDKEFSDWSLALTLLFDEWAGLEIGNKKIKLWGSQRDILKGCQGFKAKLKEILFQVKILDSFKMGTKEMERYLQVIDQWQPKLILAYSNSIYELSLFIKHRQKKVCSSVNVITSAGILTDQMRDVIGDVFGGSVFNSYGTREVGGVACSCDCGDALHVNMFNHYLEILDKDLNPTRKGKIGNIYITTLNNKTMPLIRYKIGDLAIPADGFCSCGRGWPLIQKVIGRETDVFRKENGEIIAGEFFIHFIGVVFNKSLIEKFQVVQEDFDKIKIKIVTRKRREFKQHQSNIVKNIRSVMGGDCKVDFEFVEEIPSSPSGKYLYTISKVKDPGNV